jgi:hypothetical protein
MSDRERSDLALTARIEAIHRRDFMLCSGARFFSYGQWKEFSRGLVARPLNSLAVLMPPREPLVGVDSAFSLHTCDRCARHKRCLYNPALLFRRTQQPIPRTTVCSNFNRLAHNAIVGLIKLPV